MVHGNRVKVLTQPCSLGARPSKHLTLARSISCLPTRMPRPPCLPARSRQRIQERGPCPISRLDLLIGCHSPVPMPVISPNPPMATQSSMMDRIALTRSICLRASLTTISGLIREMSITQFPSAIGRRMNQCQDSTTDGCEAEVRR